MNTKIITMLILALFTSTRAAAQGVEVLHYSDRSPSSFRMLEPMRTSSGAAPQSEVTDIFEDGFAALAADGPSAGLLDRPIQLDVPLWLRAGVPPSRLGFQLLTLPTGSCLQGYRPRLDLHPTVERRRRSLFPLVAMAACEVGLSPALLDALVVQESRYDGRALSPKGAVGLTQLMPATARQLGVANSWSALDNLRGGARYLRQQLDEFGAIELALAAYNAGPGRVRRSGRVPAITETQRYVAAITSALMR